MSEAELLSRRLGPTMQIPPNILTQVLLAIPHHLRILSAASSSSIVGNYEDFRIQGSILKVFFLKTASYDLSSGIVGGSQRGPSSLMKCYYIDVFKEPSIIHIR